MNSLKIAFVASMLTGCATHSGVMESEGGTYLISAQAAPAAGGAAGANRVAFEEAQKFCAAKDARAVAVNAQDRDVYQSSAAGSFNKSGGAFGGGTFASGNANLRFRCEK